jgi:hypothetical protein
MFCTLSSAAAQHITQTNRQSVRAATDRVVSARMEERFSLCCLDDVTWVVTAPTGFSGYDFDFTQRFTVRHPSRLETEVVAIARMGAANDYAARYAALKECDIRLIHIPEMYERTSYLPKWLPRLETLTPRSVCFEVRPSAEEVEALLGWPVFVKGARQTSRHKRSLCVARDATEFNSILQAWDSDDILWWQPMVCRELVALRRVADPSPDLLPVAFEFRSFWYRQQLVGIGAYWSAPAYALTARECDDALAVGSEAARLLAAPFVVIDLAQCEDGRWIVIECNDGQDAGYSQIDRVALWQRIVAIDRARI